MCGEFVRRVCINCREHGWQRTCKRHAGAVMDATCTMRTLMVGLMCSSKHTGRPIVPNCVSKTFLPWQASHSDVSSANLFGFEKRHVLHDDKFPMKAWMMQNLTHQARGHASSQKRLRAGLVCSPRVTCRFQRMPRVNRERASEPSAPPRFAIKSQ